jgi:hypothetical protein
VVRPIASRRPGRRRDEAGPALGGLGLGTVLSPWPCPRPRPPAVDFSLSLSIAGLPPFVRRRRARPALPPHPCAARLPASSRAAARPRHPPPGRPAAAYPRRGRVVRVSSAVHPLRRAAAEGAACGSAWPFEHGPDSPTASVPTPAVGGSAAPACGPASSNRRHRRRNPRNRTPPPPRPGCP